MPRKASVNHAVPVPTGDTESVRIRQISNGWLISREGMKRGKYVQHEEFSATKPSITAGGAEKSGVKAKR
jgi:hypothetical protein